jgi:hypothetical protein
VLKVQLIDALLESVDFGGMYHGQSSIPKALRDFSIDRLPAKNEAAASWLFPLDRRQAKVMFFRLLNHEGTGIAGVPARGR